MKPKTGGRVKGTPNKVTAEIRKSLAIALDGELERLPETLEALEPAQKVDAILKLCKYLLPTLESMKVHVVDKQAMDSSNYRQKIESDIEFDKLMSI